VRTLDILYNSGYNVLPVQADTVPAHLINGDASSISGINGNYSLAAGVKMNDALASQRRLRCCRFRLTPT